MTAFVDKPKLWQHSRTQDLSDHEHEHEQLKEAYELAVSTLFGETAMTFVPLPGSICCRFGVYCGQHARC
jgi:hypothetical protein